MRWSILLFALTFLLGPGGSDAVACQCVAEPGPPCQNYFQSDVVFVGTVRSLTTVDAPEPLARLRVEFEDVVFSRPAQATSTVVFTFDGAGTCGYPFQYGARYVVYASRLGNQVVATICSRTRPVPDADDDLKFFGDLGKPSTGGRVFGSVDRWDLDTASPDMRTPVENVLLKLRDTGRSIETRTDKAGRYQFDNLQPGRYELTITPPPLFAADTSTRRFDVPDPRACATADFVIRYDGRITGAMIGADGSPLAGAMVEAVFESRTNARIRIGFEPGAIMTNAEGTFEFANLPPGRYRITVNIPRSPDLDVLSPTAYYPGTWNPAMATAFDLRPGERIQLGRFVLPPLPASYRISGRVTFADGRPASGASVGLFETIPSWKQMAVFVEADSDGRFSFLVHEGLSYVASASVVDPGTPQRTSAAGSTRFVGSAESVKEIEVILRQVRQK